MDAKTLWHAILAGRTRSLRSVAACSCFAAVLGLLLLFGRSFSSRDTLQGPCIAVFSWHGQLAIMIDWDRKNARLLTASRPRSSLHLFPDGQLMAFGNRAIWPPTPSPIGFSWKGGLEEPRIAFPHWSLIVLLALIATALKPPPRLRFSLRGLLMLTTILALAIGGSIGLLRALHKSF